MFASSRETILLVTSLAFITESAARTGFVTVQPHIRTHTETTIIVCKKCIRGIVASCQQGGRGGPPKGDPGGSGGSPQPFSSVSDDQDKLLEGLLEPNASDSSDILACKGPNNGFQLALGVRLASRFPIQVEK